MTKNKLFWIILLAICWEILSRIGVIPSFILPPLSKVCLRSFELIMKENYICVITSSLKTVLYGFIVSFVLAIIVAFIAVSFEPAESLVLTLHDILNPLPSVAILPIILLITGLSSVSMYILIVHAVFWPLMSVLLMSFHSVPLEYRSFAKNIGVSKTKICIFILIPAIFPYLLSGVRNSWGRAWRSLISAEAIFYISGSQHGLGYWIYSNRAYANMCDVMVGVFMIILISISVERLFKLIERSTIEKWGVKK